MSDAISTQIGAYAGYLSFVMMIIGTVIAAVNHKRIRSECCGRAGSVSLDIDNTTPKGPEAKPAVAV
jgi:hypothetical protein